MSQNLKIQTVFFYIFLNGTELLDEVQLFNHNLFV